MRASRTAVEAEPWRVRLASLLFFVLFPLGACADAPEGLQGHDDDEPRLVCQRPPDLSNPLTFNGACPGDPGFPNEVMAKGRDVSIQLPANRVCYQPLHVLEGADVWIRGGAFMMTDASAAAVVSVSRSSGTTFIEGLNIDVAGKAADAIRVFRHTGRLIVQNTFARRISGRTNGVHGDLVHAQGDGPLAELILQNVSGYTGYQGLFTPYRPREGHGTHRLELDRVNVAYDPDLNRGSGAGKPLMLLFLGNADDLGDLPPDRGTSLSDVYVDSSLWSRAFESSVYPRPQSSFGRCAAFEGEHGIIGEVCDGPPPEGDFAPQDAVGLNYARDRFCGGEGHAPSRATTTREGPDPARTTARTRTSPGSRGSSAIDPTLYGARR